MQRHRLTVVHDAIVAWLGEGGEVDKVAHLVRPWRLNRGLDFETLDFLAFFIAKYHTTLGLHVVENDDFFLIGEIAQLIEPQTLALGVGRCGTKCHDKTDNCFFHVKMRIDFTILHKITIICHT